MYAFQDLALWSFLRYAEFFFYPGVKFEEKHAGLTFDFGKYFF